ncbi:MAG: dihydrolipoyl dehydrogenase [Leptospirillia bacterium]
MPTVHEVDLFTIGAGGGAYPAAFLLARSGLRVVMADTKGVMSGNCLAEGCVPSKSVREIAAHLVRQRRFAFWGLPGELSVDYRGVVAHKDRVQKYRYDQHAQEMAELPTLRLVTGRARFLDDHTIIVEGDRGEERYRARTIIVASGCDIVRPDFPGADLFLDSRDFFALNPTLTERPASLVIVGGGYIGLETATMFHALGTEVTLIEKGPRVLSTMDTSMVEELCGLLDPGIRILTNTRILKAERTESGMALHYQTGDAAPEVVRAEKGMVAVGRRPLVPEGFEAIGGKVGPRGIVADLSCQTSIPHIYAAGDVNGISPLFHSAVRQSLVAAHNIMAGCRAVDAFNPAAVPVTVFTLPEAAWVGLVPDEANRRGIPFVSGRYNFAEDSRAQILGETGGGITLFFEPESLRLLGGTIVGVDAASIVGEIGLAVAGRLTARDLAHFPDQHPMAAEGIGKAARILV